jgi:hypothetical protein
MDVYGPEATSALATVKRIGTGLSLIGAPLLFTLGMVLHPATSTDGAEQLRIVVNDPERWDIAHCLVLISMTLFIPAAMGMMNLLRAGGGWFGLFGAALVAVGAVLVGALVGAALTFTAFAGLPAGERATVTPAVQAIVDLEGALPVAFVGLIGITVGPFLLGLGLWVARTAPRWASAAIMAGAAGLLVLLLAEVGEQANAVVAAVLLIGMGAVGVQILRGSEPSPAPSARVGMEPASS